MLNLSIDLTGYQKLMSKLSLEELDELLDYIEKEIEDTQALVFFESQRIVPVDTGLLKNSGRMHEIKRDASGIEALISYHTHYALWVHERTEIPHYNPVGARAKYLEEPLANHADDFVKRLRGTIEDYFRV